MASVLVTLTPAGRQGVAKSATHFTDMFQCNDVRSGSPFNGLIFLRIAECDRGPRRRAVTSMWLRVSSEIPLAIAAPGMSLMVADCLQLELESKQSETTRIAVLEVPPLTPQTSACSADGQEVRQSSVRGDTRRNDKRHC